MSGIYPKVAKTAGQRSGKPSRRTVSEIRLLSVLLIVVCAAVFAVHWSVLSAKAVSFDDEQYLFENHLVQNPSWHSAWRFLSEVLKPSTVHGYYQPLTMISLMLDFAAGGRADNLVPFHLTSLCLHTVNTALVIVFLYMLFGEIWPAVIVGLLFGVHPLTVEPIPWIGERKTLLASFFALWCLIIYVRYTRKTDWKLFIGVMAAYVLALTSKPTVTLLPVLLLLLDFWPLRRLNKKALTEKLPLLVIMVVFAFITVISQERAAIVRMPGEYGPGRISLILCHNIIFYLYKIVWPVRLSSHYPFPSPLSASDPLVFAGIIGTCILLVALVLSIRWTRAFLAGWLFFFVAIFPTMGVIGFTNAIASDKYAYFPSVGLLMVLTWLLGRLWTFARSLLIYRIIIVVFILSLAAVESIATHRHSLHWQTSEGLYEYMLSMTPNVSVLHCNYGGYLCKSGRFDIAMRHFSEAVRIMPQNFQAYNNMGVVYSMEGETEKAIACWERVLKLKPDLAAAINNLAWAKATNENPRFRNPKEALELAQRACKMTEYSRPDYLDTLAAAYAAVGRFPDAIETAGRGLNLAQTTGQKELAQEMQKRLDLYQAGRCYLQKHP